VGEIGRHSIRVGGRIGDVSSVEWEGVPGDVSPF
jgi:hypothetical protein